MQSISLSLQIWHPMLSSKDLQEAFIIKPDIEYSVGNERLKKNGEKTGGRMILYIAVYTKDHFSTILPYNFTQYCSELGILVGLEIFNTFLDD